MSRLRHQLLENGEVLVSLVGERTTSLRVPPCEAKRFAWAVLNDLCPEEADESGYVSPEIAAEVGRPAERGWRPGAWQREAILALLEDGPMNTAIVASRLNITRVNAAVQLSRLRARKQVMRLSVGRAGYPSLWSLPPAAEGRAA